MKTEEFKKEINEIGFCFVNRESGIIDIFESDYGKRLAGADANHVCVFDLCGNGIVRLDVEKRKKLAKVVIAYAMTPISEREPKRYFRYRLKPIAGYCQRDDNEFLNYGKREGYWFLDDSCQAGRWQTIFEENDPVLNDVNLEMFEAIEVDQKGNEIKK